MNSEFTVVLVGSELREVSDELKKIKAVPLVVESATPLNFKDVLAKAPHPQLVIFEASDDVEHLKKMVHLATLQIPSLSWAVTGKQTDIDSVLAYFRIGAVDFLPQPIRPDDIKRLLHKIIHLEHSNQSGLNKEMNLSVAFFSTKGGVGLTTLATNLAVELATRQTGKVLLIDLVLQHGNVADFLDLPPKFTLLDMIENIDRLDSNLIENSLVKHASGFFVLPCPKQPEDEDFISPNQTLEILMILKRMFHYIVIDAGHEFTKTSIAALDFIDHIFLVATPDVPSLCNGRNAFGVLNRMGYGPEKVKMVLNKWKMKGEISAEEIKKNLSMELFAQVPDDWMNCLAAVNQGSPVSQVAGKSEFVKGIRSLAAQIDHLKAKEVPHVTARAA